MATVEPATRPHGRHGRRRPFAWMKRLANLKSSSTSPDREKKKQQGFDMSSRLGNGTFVSKNNNPYPESGSLQNHVRPRNSMNERLSFQTNPMSDTTSFVSSYEDPNGHVHAPLRSNKSAAPTLATNPETIHSEAGFSKAGTSNTVGGGMSSRDGRNSTFSSPSHSERSLTTTLTTIQSTAPSALLNTNTNGTNGGPSTVYANPNGQLNAINFLPTSPASAVPPHLQQLHPHTYSAATANGVLTDDASIMTLASSSKRRRRNSFDTNASVRAIAPSSNYGGSRESLPLSVLSGTLGNDGQPRTAVGSLINTERASVYSSSGVTAPALSSERNSYYADKTKSISSAAGVPGVAALRDNPGGENGSIRSGRFGHGKTDSISGVSISSPLASPRDVSGKLTSMGGEWARNEANAEEEEDVAPPCESGSETEGDTKQPAKGKGKLIG